MRTATVGLALLVALVLVAVGLRAVLTSGAPPPQAPPEDRSAAGDAEAPLSAGDGEEDEPGPPVEPARVYEELAVRGFVRKVDDDTPVEGAEVALFGYGGGAVGSAATDAEGFFEFGGTDPGAYALRIDKEGVGRLRADAVRPMRTAPVYRLAAGGTLFGRVLSAPDRTPVAAYRILAVPVLFPKEGEWDQHRIIHHQLLTDEFAAESLDVEDPDGEFRFTGLEPGKYVLLVFPREARAPAFDNGGKEWYHRWDGFEVAAGGEAGPVEVVLGVPGTIRLKVLDAGTRKPLTGVTFLAGLRVDRRHVDVPVTPLRSEADGVYELPVALDERGQVDNTFLTLVKDGYGTLPWSFAGFADGALVEVVMGRAARVRGTVVDGGGRPVAGAHVLVQEMGGEQVLTATRTDSQGRYDTGPVMPGDSLAVRVFDATRANLLAAAPLVLSPGEVKVLDFGSGKSAAVYGRVEMAGKPVRLATVQLDSERTYLWANTGADGRYRIDGLGPGKYEAIVIYAKEGEEAVWRTIPLELEAGEQRRLDFAADLVISGVALLDEGGKLAPVTDEYFEVSARREGEESRASVRIMKEGKFVLRLDGPGIYELGLLDVEGYVEREPIRVDLTREKSVTGVRFVVLRDAMNGSITIHLKDAVSGEPVSEGTYGWRHKWTTGAGILQEAKITFEECGIGTYRIHVESDRHMRAEVEVEITTTEKIIERDLALTPSNAVRVRAVVEGSPAGRAGIVAGDVVTKYEGHPVRWIAELQEAVKATTPDRLVEVEILRGGRRLTLSLPGGRMGVTIENHRAE